MTRYARRGVCLRPQRRALAHGRGAVQPRGRRAAHGRVGGHAADRPHPEVVAALAEIGIDLPDTPGRLLDPELADAAGRLVSMGCSVEDACPATTTPMTDWALDDPKGQPMPAVRAIRDDIAARVRNLIAELDAQGSASEQPSPRE